MQPSHKSHRILGNFLLFILGLGAFIVALYFYGLYGWAARFSNSSNRGTAELFMELGLISGLIGLISLLLGKRRWALKCFIIMALPMLFLNVR